MESVIGFPPPSSGGASHVNDMLSLKHEHDGLMDDAARTRRRRRRTSPQDQAILEEEYRKCDRPDKVRRKEITRMVNLGEKEVQIWFCNKRQAQRRRATPLQPHELIPRSSQHASSSQESLEQFASSSPRFLCLTSDSVLDSADGTSSPTSAPASKQPTSDDCGSSLAGPPHDHPPSSVDPPLPDAQRSHDTTLPLPLSEHTESRSSAPPTMATLTPESEMTTSAHQRLQEVLSRPPPAAPLLSRRTTSAIPTAPPRLLKRSSSVRLSTNLEGKATVILEDEPSLTSSPPIPIRKPSVCRPTKRVPLGPVDSKLWEFCCDNQSAIRSPQSTPPQPAEATQALRLLRSKSTNAVSRKRPDSERLPKCKKRKIITGDGQQAGPRKGFSIFEPSVDSDKENRPPGAPASPPPEPKSALLPSPKIKPIPHRGLSDRSRGNNMAYDASQESVDVEAESNAHAALMSSSQRVLNSSPRRIAEIECIENLLSLRGGSWR